MDQLKSLLLSVAVLFGVALKAGIAIGATGTVVEAFGLFLQRFSNSKVRAVGSFFEQLGKKLEAIGTDIPKLVNSAKVWYDKIAALLGLALVFFLVMTALAACDKPPVPCSPNDTVMAAHAVECAARVRAECANVPDNECPAVAECDAWGEARCGVAHASGGSGGQGLDAGAPSAGTAGAP